MTAQIIQDNDTAVWHTDILWNAITGVISSTVKCTVSGVDASKNNDIVHFPSHPHALDWFGNPINYQSHDVWVIGTAKITLVGEKAALDGDRVPVADWAGWDAYMVATQTKFYSN